ncbi:MAG: hypothetical protein QOI55_2647, partial [Actinomycetota bacterium]|nr:hypothetical protein [Actinomycetota bacterium]
MRRTSVRVIAVVAAVLSMLTLGLSLTSAGAGVRRAQPAAPSHRRPVIFVHGFTGSGAQFETQALRFTSNGYAPKLIAVHEYDSLFGVETRDQVFARLDQRIADLLRASHADQVDLLGHSLGTTLMQAYLNSTPARAAKVAHYVNLDGATATSPPGGVPTLAIWGMGSTTRKIVGAANLYFTKQTHVQVVTSRETFEQIYTFFTGKEPTTTNVLPEHNINLAGRAQIFPQNTGFDGTLEIFQVNGATGKRLDNNPVATFALHGDGAWG